MRPTRRFSSKGCDILLTDAGIGKPSVSKGVIPFFMAISVVFFRTSATSKTEAIIIHRLVSKQNLNGTVGLRDSIHIEATISTTSWHWKKSVAREKVNQLLKRDFPRDLSGVPMDDIQNQQEYGRLAVMNSYLDRPLGC